MLAVAGVKQRPNHPQQRPCHPQESWQSAIGRATSRGDLRLVVQSVVRLPMILLANYSVDGGIAPPVVRPVVKAIVVCDRNGRW